MAIHPVVVRTSQKLPCTRDKSGLPKPVGPFLWEPWRSAQNVMPIHLKVEIIESGPKWWRKRLADPPT